MTNLTKAECLKILCLPAGTELTKKNIRRAYFSLSMSLHPDKNTHPDANEQFQKLNAAYQDLTEILERKQSGEKKKPEPKPSYAGPDGRWHYSPFPQTIHIIDSTGHDEFQRTELFLKTLTGHSFRLCIEFRKDHSKLNPRLVIEALLTAYLEKTDKTGSLEQYIPLAKTKFPRTASDTTTASDAIFTSQNTSTQALTRQLEISKLSDQQVAGLADLYGLKWVSAGKPITATMPAMNLTDFYKLTIGGYILLTHSLPQLTSGATPPERALLGKGEQKLTAFRAFIYDRTHWRGVVPTGVNQIRAAIESEETSYDSLLSVITDIATERLTNRNQETGIGRIFKTMLQNSQATTFYQEIKKAKTMDELVEWCKNPTNGALVVPEDASGGASKESVPSQTKQLQLNDGSAPTSPSIS